MSRIWVVGHITNLHQGCVIVEKEEILFHNSMMLQDFKKGDLVLVECYRFKNTVLHGKSIIHQLEK